MKELEVYDTFSNNYKEMKDVGTLKMKDVEDELDSSPTKQQVGQFLDHLYFKENEEKESSFRRSPSKMPTGHHKKGGKASQNSS